jgi:hypothetical protein
MIYRLMILSLLTIGSLGATIISLNAAPIDSRKPNADLQIIEQKILQLKIDIKTALDQKFSPDNPFRKKAIDKLKLFMKFEQQTYELNIEAPQDIKTRELIEANESQVKNEVLADKDLFRAFSIVRQIIQEKVISTRSLLDSLGYKDILSHINLFVSEITDEDRLQIKASLAALEKLNEVDKISSQMSSTVDKIRGMAQEISDANDSIARLSNEVDILSEQLGETLTEFPTSLAKALSEKQEKLELAYRTKQRAANLRNLFQQMNALFHKEYAEYLQLRREAVKKLREDNAK